MGREQRELQADSGKGQAEQFQKTDSLARSRELTINLGRECSLTASLDRPSTASLS